MANAPPQEHYYTPEEYLALEREAEFKSEYFDGGIYAMSGGTPAHSKIISNTNTAIGAQLWNSPCDGYNADLKVRALLPRQLFTYPDFTVVCGELQFHEGTNDVVINPQLIVEVLSPSTELFDRGAKFIAYQTLESLTDYIIVLQDRPRVEHFSRQAGGAWLMTPVEGLSASLYIASIGCTLELSKVYKSVTFPPQLQIRVGNETRE